MDDDTPVTIRRYMDPMEAELDRGRLEAEGIEAYLQESFLSSMDSPLLSSVGGLGLQVARRDAARAEEILAAGPVAGGAEADEPAHGGERAVSSGAATGRGEERCPRCGSPRIRPIAGADLRNILLSLLLPARFFPPERRMRCLSCGKKWLEGTNDYS